MNTHIPPLTAARRAARGVSLIEALVALAVMSVGLLGVVGMQATLRTNADLSRQRSEAVRMAQGKMEELRAFNRMEATPCVPGVFSCIASTTTPDDVTPASGLTNATFKRSVTVSNPGTGAPAFKTITVAVQWWDKRADGTDPSDPNSQQVVLTTAIAQVDPVLGASLGLPTNRSVTQKPMGRSVSIPPAALGQSDGTSTFSPPGSPSGVTWVFSNDTGRIIKIGNTYVQALLLSGYIRFATEARDSRGRLIQPTGVHSEMPPGDALPVNVRIALTAPVLATYDPAPVCYTGSPDASGAVPYNCAVPTFTSALGQTNTNSWSGRSTLTGLALATSAQDDSSDRYRVCRYTDRTTDTPSAGNVAHPLNYSGVSSALTNQNFLVIRAGRGSSEHDSPYDCPSDDTSTEFVNGDTRLHQPL